MNNFDEATAVRQTADNVYEAHFHGEWCIGSVPHGGYVTSIFMRVVRAHFSTTLSRQNQPHTIALHLEFLRRTEVGPARFVVKDVKLGRQTSTVHITLSQNGREEVVGYATNSNISKEEGHSFETGWNLDPPRAPVNISKLREDKDENWFRQDIMPFQKFRKASTRVRFHFPRKGQALKSMVDQWISLQSGQRWTNDSLGFVSDMFPQIIESYRFGTDPYATVGSEKQLRDRATAEAQDKALTMLWFPTVLLNLDIKKALPVEGVEFLGVRVRAKAIKNGRMDLEVVVLDTEGEIVALSHHVVLIVSAERNTAKRRKAEEKAPEEKNSKL